MPEENDPIHLDKRIQVISQTITKLRNDLISTRENLLIIINENMALLEKELSRFGHQVKSLEEERSKMLALTNISQVINSSLDLDEVLELSDRIGVIFEGELSVFSREEVSKKNIERLMIGAGSKV